MKVFKEGQEVVCTTDEFNHTSNCGLFTFSVPVMNGIYHIDKYHPDSEFYVYLRDCGGSHCWDAAGFEPIESIDDAAKAVKELLIENL